jgi:hypothetical protein
MSTWKRTGLKYANSEDRTFTALGSFSYGKFYLQNDDGSFIRKVKYKCLGISLSKGIALGFSESTVKSKSSGTDVLTHSGYFSDDFFPCGGYILSLGATLGVLDSETGEHDPSFANGVQQLGVIFGLIPYAKFTCNGQFAASTPGLGFSMFGAYFSLDDD